MTATARFAGFTADLGIPGERAISRAQLVPTTDCVGTVHSVFATACNLAVGDVLITVHDAARHHTPTSIRVRSAGPVPWAPNVRPGERVEQRDGLLRFGRHLLDLSVVVVWQPSSSRLVVDSPVRHRDLTHQLALLEDFRRRGAPMMDPRLDSHASALTTALRAVCVRTTTSLSSDPQPEIDASVKRLLGDGPGLTPAGDDILVGLLAVLSSAEGSVEQQFSGMPVGSDVGGLSAAVIGLRAAVIRHLARTNEISAHYLGLAVAGHFGQSIDGLLGALANGASDQLLLDRAAAVIKSTLLGAMAVIGALIPATILLIVAAVTANAGNMFQGTLAISTLIGLLRKWQITVAIGIAAAVVGSFDVTVWLPGFLLFLGIAAPPVAGIYIADFFLNRRGGYDPAVLRHQPAIRVLTFVAWILGSGIGYLTADTSLTLTGIPSIDSILVAALAYAVISAVRSRSRSNRARSMAPTTTDAQQFDPSRARNSSV
jgi:hypothetical protein